MNQHCSECIKEFRGWGADPRKDGSCTSYACANYAGQKEREVERWGEYILNGSTPVHLPTPSREIHQALNARDRQEVVELERKVQGLNKALATHLTAKPKKRESRY